MAHRKPNNANLGEIFETVHPGTLVVTNVSLSGFDHGELTSLLYRDGAFFAGDLNPSGSSRFFRITTGGVVTYLGDMDHVAKGLAPVGTPPTVPALSLPMLAVVVGALILLGWGRILASSRR